MYMLIVPSEWQSRDRFKNIFKYGSRVSESVAIAKKGEAFVTYMVAKW